MVIRTERKKDQHLNPGTVCPRILEPLLANLIVKCPSTLLAIPSNTIFALARVPTAGGGGGGGTFPGTEGWGTSSRHVAQID